MKLPWNKRLQPNLQNPLQNPITCSGGTESLYKNQVDEISDTFTGLVIGPVLICRMELQ